MKSLAAILLLLVALPAAADDRTCPCGQSLACYQSQNYRVGKIRIDTVFEKNPPLEFVFRLQQLLFDDFDRVKPTLELQEGEKFTVAGYNNSVIKLGSLLGTPKYKERFKLLLLEPGLENCNADAGTIDILYKVFTTDGLAFLTTSFERPNDKVSRTVVIPLPGTDKNKLLPQPYVGFNSSRGLFGGSKAAFKTSGGIFNEMDLDVSGSGSSATVDMDLSGSREFNEGFLNHLEWKLGYSYSNIPSDGIRLKDATVHAQVFGGTRPMGQYGLALRFGGSVEGGNRQADMDAAAAPLPPTATESRYGAVKGFVGATLNRGRQALRASYALQLGQAGPDLRVDYIKQLVDGSYSVRFLPREHRPLRLDVSGAAGLITGRTGLIPIGERFFGGNVKENFIQGSDWEISGGPTIRSFPQNSLNLIGTQPIGGTKFFSLNLTLAQTVWYRSAVPEELARDPELKIKLTGAITTERENAKSSYLDLAPEFIELLGDLDKLEKILTELQGTLAAASGAQPAPEVAAAIKTFFDVDDNSGFKPLPDPLDAIKTAKTDKKQTVDQAVSLAQDVPELPAESYITVLIRKILGAQQSFTAAGLPTDTLISGIEPLKAIQQDILKRIPLINEIGQYAASDIQSVAAKVNNLPPVLDSIERQLAQLPQPQANDPVKEYAAALNQANQYLQAARDGIIQVNQDDVTVRGAERLAVGYGKVAQGLLTGLVAGLRSLQGPLMNKGRSADAAALEADAKRLVIIQGEIRRQLRSVSVPEIEKRANRDVAFTGRVLDVIFRELNIVAFSPLVMIDAARIGPQVTPALDKVRYGIGGGLRFSLVSLDLDIGYSFNPGRLPGERRGAFVFSMSVSDLFR